MKQYPSQELLNTLFVYDEQAGVLMRGNRIAGGIGNDKYRSILISGSHYMAHILIWIYVKGYQPKRLDHINGIRDDNRIENLRESTESQNQANSKRKRTNKSGFKGVYLKKGPSKWNLLFPYVAAIMVDRKHHHLGYFKTPEEAHAVYLKAAKEFFGEFARAA